MITSPPPRPPPSRVRAAIGSTALGAPVSNGALVPPPKSSSSSKPKAPLPPLEIYDKRNHKLWVRKELLGEGGFAKCFRVSEGVALGTINHQIDGIVSSKPSHLTDSAVKVVWKASLKSGKQRQKLLSEIKIHQSLSHPNIVLFKSVFEDDENVYIILEVCEQKTFVDLIKKRKRLTDSEVRFWMWQLLDGIRYMHRKGYIHRDIKLGNLFLDSKLNLKIGDFGLAAQIEHDGERKKTICGTPNYIAPEILFDTKNGHSFEVDIWSLGVVMYTLLIGKPPFQTKDVKAIYKNIRDNLYQFPENVPISSQAREIITAFLHPKPENRPSIDDVMEHPYFDRSLIPRSIPLSALVEVPILTFQSDTENAGIVSSVKSPIARIKSHAILRSPNSQGSDSSKNPPTLPPRAIESIGDASPLKPPSLPARLVSPTIAPPRKVLTSLNRSDMSPQKQLVEKLSHASLSSPSPSIRNSQSWVDTPEKTSPYVPASQKRFSHTENQENHSTSLTESQNLYSPLSVANSAPSASAAVPLAVKDASSSESSGKLKNDSTKGATSVLDHIYNFLKSEIKRAASLAAKNFSLIGYSIETAPHPSVYITKWIDYTNKYGLSYQFRNGSVGVYFNDGTSIILSQNGSSFEYLYYDRSGDRPVMHRRHHSLESPPTDLSKKITLLKHFRGYMIENLTRASASDNIKSENETPPINGMDFLTKYVRTKQGVLFRISNHSIQLNLFDHTKLIISENGRCITFINAQRMMETRPTRSWIDSRNEDVLKRIIYCADLVEKMLAKSSRAPECLSVMHVFIFYGIADVPRILPFQLMPWTKTEIQQFYDTYAKAYDSESSLEVYPSPTILSCWLLESLQIQHQNATKSKPKQLNVIDVGCGTGQSSSIFFAQLLASDQEQTLQYKVTGVDASKNMLKIAEKYPFKALLNLDIENELTSKVEAETFDGLICVGVIDFIRDVRKLLLNFESLLVHGGHAALTLPETPNSDLNHFTPDEMKSMIEDTGFLIVKNERILGYIDSENGTTTYYHGFLLKKCNLFI